MASAVVHFSTRISANPSRTGCAPGGIHHREHTNDYLLVDDEATLVWPGQLASLEIHVLKWRFDAAGAQRNPDRLVFDLDPETASRFDSARVPARTGLFIDWS